MAQVAVEVAIKTAAAEVDVIKMDLRITSLVTNRVLLLALTKSLDQ